MERQEEMKRENVPSQEEGESVIDYIIGSEEVWEKIREIKIGYRIDSDHQPIEALVKEKEKWCRKNRVSNKVRRGI